MNRLLAILAARFLWVRVSPGLYVYPSGTLQILVLSHMPETSEESGLAPLSISNEE